MTAGQHLVALSGLAGVSAAQHLLAITAGTGTGPGATVFVDRMTLSVEIPKLTVTRRLVDTVRFASPPEPTVTAPASAPVAGRNRTSTAARSRANRIDILRRQPERIDLRLSPDEVWVTQRAVALSFARGRMDRVSSAGSPA